MDFPVEIWMTIFENATNVVPFARRHFTKAFDDLTIGESERMHHRSQSRLEAEIVSQLPKPEKRAWKDTRFAYTISRNSRAAAQRLDFSKMMLSSAVEPGITFPTRKLGPFPKLLDGPGPCTFSIWLWGDPLIQNRLEMRFKSREAWLAMSQILGQSTYEHRRLVDRPEKFWETVEHVVILADGLPEGYVARAKTFAQRVASEIRLFWRADGYDNRRVEIVL